MVICGRLKILNTFTGALTTMAKCWFLRQLVLCLQYTFFSSSFLGKLKYKIRAWILLACGVATVLYPISTVSHSLAITSSLQQWYNNSQHSDIQFQVGEKVFFAYKVFLAGISYFQQFFTNKMKKSHQQVITLQETDTNFFQSILQYLYL